MSERIDAAAARLLGISRASGTEKGLAKDIRTVLDALTVAQGKAVLSQPTAEPVHRVSIYPVSEFAVADRLTIVAECSSCGRMGTWTDTFEGNRQAQSFARAHANPELIYTTMPVLPAPSTAEPVCVCNLGPDTDGPEIDCPIHGLPLVEDMAIGTTFTARHADNWKRFEYVGEGRIRFVGGNGSAFLASGPHGVRIYTIRDITPPKEHQ